MDKIIEQGGGYAYSQGVKHVVTMATGNPVVGKAAQVASTFVPARAKNGAAVGAIVGGSIAGKAMTIGTAGAFAWGTAMFLPFILGGAVVAGTVALLCGDD